MRMWPPGTHWAELPVGHVGGAMGERVALYRPTKDYNAAPRPHHARERAELARQVIAIKEIPRALT